MTRMGAPAPMTRTKVASPRLSVSPAPSLISARCLQVGLAELAGMDELLREPRIAVRVEDLLQPGDEVGLAGVLPQVRMVGEPDVDRVALADVDRHDPVVERRDIGRQ